MPRLPEASWLSSFMFMTMFYCFSYKAATSQLFVRLLLLCYYICHYCCNYFSLLVLSNYQSILHSFRTFESFFFFFLFFHTLSLPFLARLPILD